jgi:hypothetical protein
LFSSILIVIVNRLQVPLCSAEAKWSYIIGLLIIDETEVALKAMFSNPFDDLVLRYLKIYS